jgi:hypothetical protein
MAGADHNRAKHVPGTKAGKHVSKKGSMAIGAVGDADGKQTTVILRNRILVIPPYFAWTRTTTGGEMPAAFTAVIR